MRGQGKNKKTAYKPTKIRPSELCYAFKETVYKNKMIFYLPVKECKPFVLFSDCEITTDWYVIKLVYVYIMTDEITEYIRELPLEKNVY